MALENEPLFRWRYDKRVAAGDDSKGTEVKHRQQGSHDGSGTSGHHIQNSERDSSGGLGHAHQGTEANVALDVGVRDENAGCPANAQLQPRSQCQQRW